MATTRYRRAVILDHGSDACKAGLSSNDYPKVIVPSIIGYCKLSKEGTHFVGHRAEGVSNILATNCPIQRGLITNWDDMENIWSHIFYKELRMSTEDQPILLTEAPIVARSHRERVAEMMFETFNFPAVHIATQGALSLYTSGLTTGLTLDVGHEITQAVPTYEAVPILPAMTRIDSAGKDITNYLRTLLDVSGNAPSGENDVKDLKERACYIPENFDVEMATAAEKNGEKKTYKLPDGRNVTVGTEKFSAPEVLFQPHLMGKDTPGLHEIITETIKRCDVDLRRGLYANIVLTGGSSLFPGMVARLHAELAKLVPGKCYIKIFSPHDRKYGVWRGASILASMSTFQNMWVSKEEFNEDGPRAIRRKCL